MSVLGREVTHPVRTISISGILTLAIVVAFSSTFLHSPLLSASQKFLGGITLPTSNSSQPAVTQATPKPDLSPQAWLNAINIERAKVGAPGLALDARLNQSAMEHAVDLQKYGRDNTPHYTEQVGKQGYDYIWAHVPGCVGGENIVWGYKDVAGGVAWWLSSKPHRDAMLNPAFTIAGFGTVGDTTVFHMCE